MTRHGRQVCQKPLPYSDRWHWRYKRCAWCPPGTVMDRFENPCRGTFLGRPVCTRCANKFHVWAHRAKQIIISREEYREFQAWRAQEETKGGEA